MPTRIASELSVGSHIEDFYGSSPESNPRGVSNATSLCVSNKVKEREREGLRCEEIHWGEQKQRSRLKESTE